MVGLKLVLVEREGGKDGLIGDGLCFVEVMECEENDVYLKFWREVLWLSWYVRVWCGL